MSETPLISVVMPVYNESIHDLHDSINSILNQTYHNFEYIIVDDNPNNNSIKGYLKKKAYQNSKIRLIFNQHSNLGAVISSNKGVSVAKGKIIDRMDADDMASKDKLSIQLQFMIHNNLDLTCSNFSVMNVNDEITRKYGYRGKTVVNQHRIRKILSHCNIAIGPTLFFKKTVFIQLNGYRNMNVEDYDLATRFLVKGYRIGYQNKPLIYKRLRKNSISYKTMLSQYMIMNTIGYSLRKSNFARIPSLCSIRRNLTKLSSAKINKFHNFINVRYSFNNNKTFKKFIHLLISIIVSSFVIKWCFWSIKNKFYQ